MKKPEIMQWERCQNEFIRKVTPDTERIASLLKMAKTEQKILAGIALTDESATKLAKDYYDIIKELLTALLLCHGMKSENHECLISFFLKQYPSYEYEAKTAHELKFYRNRISYDGFFIKKEYVVSRKQEFEHIISLLQKLIEESVPKTGQVAQ